jgi:hypothetical protein
MLRARRDSRVFDIEGREVFITKLCPRCHAMRPLSAFGLRRMGNGSIRDCPWCRRCRSLATRKHESPPGGGPSVPLIAREGVPLDAGGAGGLRTALPACEET